LITRRVAVATDSAFLHRLYAGTCAEMLEAADWNTAEQASFVAIQVSAQRRAYDSVYPDAVCYVLETSGAEGREPIGRLWVNRSETEIRVLDISLLQTHRGLGIGSGCLRQVLVEAAAAGATVTLSVEQSNRAEVLYRRLGFEITSVQPPYQAMCWSPPLVGTDLAMPFAECHL
jgi:ribosomal protein S18 acetylase RimI-like enzyme